MPHDDDTTPTRPARTDLSPITHALEEALSTSLPPENALQRQAQILDQVFHAVIRDTLAAAQKHGHALYTRENALSLALRIQKQCADTHRIAAVMDYMGALSPVRGRTLPASPQNELKEIHSKSDT